MLIEAAIAHDGVNDDYDARTDHAYHVSLPSEVLCRY